MAARLGHAGRCPRDDGGVRLDAAALAGERAAAARGCGLAALLVRLAPAGAVRHGAGTPELSPPPRAHELLRDRRAALVADRPRTPLGRWKGAVPLRRVCPRLAARPAARS